MPDLGNLLPVLQSCSSPSPPETLDVDPVALSRRWSRRLRFPISSRGTCSVLRRDRKGAKKATGGGTTLAGHVRAWVEKMMASGASERDCALPFLTNAPRMIECCICSRSVYPAEEVRCSVRTCENTYHRSCAEKSSGLQKKHKNFKCPKHVCFLCKQNYRLSCVRCLIGVHARCAPWPDDIIYLEKGRVICWKHPSDWRLEKEHAVPTFDFEEAFFRLPLPYIDEEFQIDSIRKDIEENKTEPAPYVQIKRNVYLVKKRRDGAEAGVGCTNCNANATCRDNCECRGLSVSCSKACHCSDMCKNRPFRKEKKVKVTKTNLCGWGVEALEVIEAGDFVVEYIGEVIDDALCERRLWDMKRRGKQDFYMCEVNKDFTIDATFKGNVSRFLNHGCDPNCKLEKWQVDGEMRVGVFASRSIEVGEPLTYDYRFEHFGRMVKCCCGASKCQGFFGSKRKTTNLVFLGAGESQVEVAAAGESRSGGTCGVSQLERPDSNDGMSEALIAAISRSRRRHQKTEPAETYVERRPALSLIYLGARERQQSWGCKRKRSLALAAAEDNQTK